MLSPASKAKSKALDRITTCTQNLTLFTQSDGKVADVFFEQIPASVTGTKRPDCITAQDFIVRVNR